MSIKDPDNFSGVVTLVCLFLMLILVSFLYMKELLG